jgi:molybdopterin-guanine dinucleotide biosynthesis protein B
VQVFGLVGWSGAGKTTLIVSILPLIAARGIRVSTMKHAHHYFDIDIPGKDSYRHREAGASEVLITSSGRWVLMHELRDEAEPPIRDLIERMTPVDLLLIEGFKTHAHPKLEVYRQAEAKPLMWRPGSDIVAVAADVALPEVSVPVLDINDHAGIVAFILAQTGLAR